MHLSRLLTFFVCFWAANSANAEDVHPLMDSDWWITAGTYFADRDFKASAGINLVGQDRNIDLESSTGIDDSPSIFMAELGWQYTEKWSLSLQHFRSSRSGNRVLEEAFEWQGDLYETGVRIDAETEMEITRVFFARRLRDNGPHSLRIGAGVHWLDVSAEVAGQASLNDQNTEFRRSAAKASLPVPNVGAWYRYSPNTRWIINARVDWLSASIDNFSGRIWNASAGAVLRLTDHVGLGLNYQYFELAGDVTEPDWRGEIETVFTGPHLYITGYW